MAEEKMEPKQKGGEKKKRDIISQTIIPTFSFKRSLEVAQALCDQFGARSAEPHLLAKSVNLSPTSTTWRMLSGSAIAYGLTDAGYRAKKISITELGKSIVMPTEEGEREKAIVVSVLKPKIVNDFFNRYDKSKLPSKDMGINVLKTMGIPSERAEKAFNLIVENGEYAGIISDIKTGRFVSVSVSEDFIKKEIRDEIPIKTTDDEIHSEDEVTSFIPDMESTSNIRKIPKKPLDYGQYSINLNIQLQLPETTNLDVYDKLFESMKKHLLE
jgi:hypothetical protein